MPDLLSYRPSDSAVYYRPPRRVDAGRTVVAFVAAVAGAAVAGGIYAVALPRVEQFVLRLGVVTVAVGVVAGLAAVPTRAGRVGVPVVAAALGAGVAAAAVYAMWAVWTWRVAVTQFGAAVTLSRVATHPVGLFQVAVEIGRFGTWSTHSGTAVRGPVLYGLWMAEAGLFLSAGVLVPTRCLFGREPVCPGCGSACARVPGLPRFDAADQLAVVAAVEGRAPEALAGLPPPPHEDAPELSLRLMSCPRCRQLNVLTVTRLEWHVPAGGRPVVRATPVVDGLMMAADEAGRLTAACADAHARRAAAEPPAA